MVEPNSSHVGSRLVIHIGGFDPVDPDRLNRRMVGGVSKFANLWGISASASAPDCSPDGRIIEWQVEAGGPNWSTRTNYTILRWDDLIAPYFATPWWRKFIDGFAALLHFTFNGTIWRYFVTNARYGMFVLYPFFLLIGILALSITIGSTIADISIPYAGLLGVVIAAVLFVVLLRWAGNFFHLYFALADWSFAVDLVHDRIPDFDKCLEQFADEIAARIENAKVDEIILSGVSLGAFMMVEALAKVLSRDEDFARNGPPIAFLTIGSSILKIGLHPKARSVKLAVGRVSREQSLLWVEYQSKVDPINFYKSNPVTDLGLPSTGLPIVKTIHLRETMTVEEYRYLKVNFLRLHRQFAMPNSRRYFYDYYLICFGPMALADRVALARFATEAIDENGNYTLPQSREGNMEAMAAKQ